MTTPTTNGLFLSDPGIFEDDQSADNLQTFTENVNASLTVLDPIIAEVGVLITNVTAILNTGITTQGTNVGTTYGGTY